MKLLFLLTKKTWIPQAEIMLLVVTEDLFGFTNKRSTQKYFPNSRQPSRQIFANKFLTIFTGQPLESTGELVI